MKTSCIRYPENNRYIQINEWQVNFCKGSHSAALLLSFFINWHEWKLRNDQYYCKANNIAESHGDGRPHSENAYLFFTTEELIDGCMGLYGKKAITDGLELLSSMGVVTIHKNPNPRYCFDKTKYFQLFPNICNHWIAENYPIEQCQHVDFVDSTKMDDRKGENDQPTGENDLPSRKSSQAITNTTNNTTNKNKQITACNIPSVNSDQIEPIVKLLTEKGMPTERLQDKEDLLLIVKLIEQGVTVEMISQAFDLSIRATKKRGSQFGMRYLIKVIEDIREKEKRKVTQNFCDQGRITQEPIYEHDFSGGLDWMGDLLE